MELGPGLEIGLDVRYVGPQWLRGDEANETRPMQAYGVMDTRASWARRRLEISMIVSNVFDSRRAVFGTFNENRQTEALERFFTPLHGRSVKVALRRTFGAPAQR